MPGVHPCFVQLVTRRLELTLEFGDAIGGGGRLCREGLELSAESFVLGALTLDTGLGGFAPSLLTPAGGIESLDLGLLTFEFEKQIDGLAPSRWPQDPQTADRIDRLIDLAVDLEVDLVDSVDLGGFAEGIGDVDQPLGDDGAKSIIGLDDAPQRADRLMRDGSPTMPSQSVGDAIILTEVGRDLQGELEGTSQPTIGDRLVLAHRATLPLGPTTPNTCS